MQFKNLIVTIIVTTKSIVKESADKMENMPKGSWGHSLYKITHHPQVSSFQVPTREKSEPADSAGQI